MFVLGSNLPDYIELVISAPRDFKHKLHVDANFDWWQQEPEKSFRMLQKLGEGYLIIIVVKVLFVSHFIKVFWGRIQSRAYRFQVSYGS